MNEFVDISYEQSGACLKKVIKEGYGDEYPRDGNFVSVNYTLKLVDETFVSSSADLDEPFSFVLGEGSLIKGWEVAIPTMKRKEVAVFRMESSYGYGKTTNHPLIPPDSTLIFEIELLDFKGENIGPDNDEEGVIRYVIKSGLGAINPEMDSIVEVEYVGRYNGKVFDEKKLKFELGTGAKFNLPEGFERALLKFFKKEKSRIIMKPLYAFGDSGCLEFGIPPNATVEYIIELISLEKDKPLWLMSRRDCYERAIIYKDMGGDYFKEGKFHIAFRLYFNSLRYLDCKEAPFDEDDKVYLKKIKELFVIINSNLTQCCLKMNNYYEAKKFANDALVYDEHNVKALFRRGLSAYYLSEFENAKIDFTKVLQIESDNEVAKKQLQLCDKKFEEFHKKEVSLYSTMIGKMSLYNEKEAEKELNEEIMSKPGHWGDNDRDRAPSDFEQENPDILVLNRDETFKNM